MTIKHVDTIYSNTHVFFSHVNYIAVVDNALNYPDAMPVLPTAECVARNPD